MGVSTCSVWELDAASTLEGPLLEEAPAPVPTTSTNGLATSSMPVSGRSRASNPGMASRSGRSKGTDIPGAAGPLLEEALVPVLTASMNGTATKTSHDTTFMLKEQSSRSAGKRVDAKLLMGATGQTAAVIATAMVPAAVVPAAIVTLLGVLGVVNANIVNSIVTLLLLVLVVLILVYVAAAVVIVATNAFIATY